MMTFASVCVRCLTCFSFRSANCGGCARRICEYSLCPRRGVCADRFTESRLDLMSLALALITTTCGVSVEPCCVRSLPTFYIR